MSWLDAHESFFMHLVADDRVKDLQASSEAAAECPVPATRIHDTSPVLPCHILAKATQ